MKIKKSELSKLRNEINEEFKPLNSTKEIITWYKDIIKRSKIKIKEKNFLSRGGKFIVHVPTVKII